MICWWRYGSDWRTIKGYEHAMCLKTPPTISTGVGIGRSGLVTSCHLHRQLAWVGIILACHSTSQHLNGDGKPLASFPPSPQLLSAMNSKRFWAILLVLSTAGPSLASELATMATCPSGWLWVRSTSSPPPRRGPAAVCVSSPGRLTSIRFVEREFVWPRSVCSQFRPRRRMSWGR